MLTRSQEVGNLPRYIISAASFEARKKASLTVLKQRRDKDVRSILEYDSVGYDGQLIPDYGKQTVSLMNKSVLTTIENRKLILSLWAQASRT
jgi:hypothetical protein